MSRMPPAGYPSRLPKQIQKTKPPMNGAPSIGGRGCIDFYYRVNACWKESLAKSATIWLSTLVIAMEWEPL